MKKRVGAVLFLAFLTVLFLEIWQVFAVFDPQLTNFLQAVFPRKLDIPLSVFSLLGSFEIISVALMILAVWVWRRERKIFYSLIFFAGILAFEFLGKLFLYHPGPPSIFFRYSIPFIFPTGYVHTNYSFPSGHVARTVFLTIVAGGIFRRRWVTIGAILFSLMMIFSRIYLGEHWGSDVLGGLLLGGAMGFFALGYY